MVESLRFALIELVAAALFIGLCTVVHVGSQWLATRRIVSVAIAPKPITIQQPIQLSYRGTTYEVITDAREAADLGLTGQYRGVPIQFTTPVKITVPDAAIKLTYRGADYLRPQ